jgi:2-hydroxychromene-2-carboxylate isomerase
VPARFYFGAMSPYSWFAAERIGALIPAAEWRPVFAGGLFKANGRTSWGLTDRRATGIADCDARAEAHGLGPIRWPDPWPTNDLLVARAMAHADAGGLLKPYAVAAMRLSFKEGRDLGDVASVLEAGRRAGVDPAELEAALGSPEVKRRLRATTDEAVDVGVFGVPTVRVGDTLFWGDDRLPEAAAKVASSGAEGPAQGRSSGQRP